LDAEVIAAAATRLNGQYSEFFDWLKKVRATGKKFIDLRGEYVE
jgi:hypothetical protein